MPLLIHKSPKYRKHASGNAVVTFNGRDIYLGEHGSAASRKEYRRLIAEWKANSGTLPASVASGDYSIAELIAAFWSHAQTYYAPAPGKNAGELWSIKLALRVLKKLYADTDVKDFGPLALRAVRNEMLKEDWSRKYINVQVNRLRRMFKWGVGRELVPAATWQSLQAVEPLLQGKTKARETAPVGTIDDCYVDAVLPFLNRQVRAMIELQRVTGMRPGELVIMRGVDLTTKNPKLWEYRPAEHKNTHRGHERVIYLNKAAQEIIRPFLSKELSAHIFSPIQAEEERRRTKSRTRKTPLNCGTKPGMNRARKPRRAPGAHYTTDSYRRAVTRACDLASEWATGGAIVANDERVIPRFHPHQIRHNTATRLRAEHGLEAAQVILGHRTLSATQIYAEKNVAAAKKIMMEGA